MSKVSVKCLNCGTPFLVYKCKLKNGRGKFCSRTCNAKYYNKLKDKTDPFFTMDRKAHNNPNYKGGAWYPCEICGKKFWKYPSRTQKTCSKECGQQLRRKHISGLNNPRFTKYNKKSIRNSRWGLSDEDYTKLRNKIINRDSNRCILCGSQNYLQVHHIVPRTDSTSTNDPDNLITLCRSCHKSIESNYSEEKKNYLRGKIADLRHSR